jgi:photosystem II stability/assembly factor-like uncharacterized protein
MKIKYSLFLLIVFMQINFCFAQWEMMKGPGKVNAVNLVEVQNSEIFFTIGNNIFYSKDAGNNWEAINQNNDILFNNIKDFKQVNNLLFLYTDYELYDYTRGIYVSKDNGKNWEKAENGIEEKYIDFNKFFKFGNDLFALNYNLIYKYDWIMNKWIIPYDTSKVKFRPNNFALLIENDKMYVGERVNKDIIAQYGVSKPNIFVYSLTEKNLTSVMDTLSGIAGETITCFLKKDNKLFAGTTKGVFISTNDGSNWQRKSQGLKYIDTSQTPPFEFEYEVHDLIVYKNNFFALITSPTVYGTFSPGIGGLIAYSSDNGENWTIPDLLINYKNINSIKVFGDKLLIGTNEGLFTVNDSLVIIKQFVDSIYTGDNARDLISANGSLFSTVSYAKNSLNRGIYKSVDFGKTWQISTEAPKNSEFGRIAIKDSFLIAGNSYYNKNPYYSTDAGKTFKKITTETGLKYLQTLTLDIFGEQIYIGTRKGIYCSKDWSQTWFELNSVLNEKTILSFEKFENYLFSGSNRNLLLISNDDGITWSPITIPFTDYYLNIKDIKIINNKLFVATQGYTESGGYVMMNGGGIFMSPDFGKTWEKKSEGIEKSLGFSSLVSYDNYLFTAAERNGGVYYSKDMGDNWLPYNRGLTNSYITKLLIEGKYLFAATAGGVYRVPLSDFGIVDVEDVERKNYLYHHPPYPNPATNQVNAMIYWDLALDINSADITLYDIYGKQVADKTSTTLEEQGPYFGKLTWHCNGVPPGVYLISINYGTEKKTIKVCVVE